MIDEKILVLMNTDTIPGEFIKIKFPAVGNWHLLATIDWIEPLKGINGRKESILTAGQELNFTLAGEDLRIWVRRK